MNFTKVQCGDVVIFKKKRAHTNGADAAACAGQVLCHARLHDDSSVTIVSHSHTESINGLKWKCTVGSHIRMCLPTGCILGPVIYTPAKDGAVSALVLSRHLHIELNLC